MEGRGCGGGCGVDGDTYILDFACRVALFPSLSSFFLFFSPLFFLVTNPRIDTYSVEI